MQLKPAMQNVASLFLFSVEREVVTKNGKSEETSYYITSLCTSAEKLLETSREHWKIESMHWILSYETLYDLSELTEAEQNILEAFSVFPYIPLAAETCNEWLLADAGVSEEDNILTCLLSNALSVQDVQEIQ